MPRALAAALPPPVAALAAGLEDADAFELDRRLRAAIHLEQTLDAAIAPLLRHLAAPEYAWSCAHMPIVAFAREQLGMSAGKARSLLRLARAARVCPELHDAYRSGRVSWVKARILLPLLLLDVEGEWRPIWVAWAERVTLRRLEQDVERVLLLRAGHPFAARRAFFDPERAQDALSPDERQLCARDVDVDATEELVWHVPPDVAALFGALHARLRATLRETSPEPCHDGRVFEAMLDRALAAWLLRDPGARRRDPVIERDGYRCAVPGCTSRRNLHDHHIRFRSAQGGDHPDNRVTLCAFHHLRCLHAGLLGIHGRAPDSLVFELGLDGLRFGRPLVRYRSGDVELPCDAGGAAPAWQRPRAA